ncbi:helix-turn-helix domain-containing protein [Pseudorhizobium marinum]|uniref:helix-turn-helix domain-containing protein n=1 Tax=Pseudorhizobium marinum TaxID=1496690 RepID=UPI000A91B94C|nr:helix-turn-helix domain-containing protein [Pseudorhizobium marinum]
MPQESHRPPEGRDPDVPFEIVWQPPLTRRMSDRSICRIVRQMVSELLLLLGDRVMVRRDRRRLACHVRQISMYVCHVALRMPQQDIGVAFGRDRTTVSHACHVVEDRRDDRIYDEFVSAVERIVVAVFASGEVSGHD